MSDLKIGLNKPVLLAMYGYPGSGKTAFSRQISEYVSMAHLQSDRIRHELFEKPTYNTRENEIVTHIMNYMAEEFLSAGISVVYDTNVVRVAQRRFLRDLAKRKKSVSLLIWLQIDSESAFSRIQRRDRRKSDDKYSATFDRTIFNKFLGYMQNPSNEDYVVISGKHSFNSQRNAVMKKFFELGLVDSTQATSKMVKPGMVNLIPNTLAGRFDLSRRNINIK